MDRFLLKVSVGYPDDQAELGIIRMVRGEEAPRAGDRARVDPQCVFDAREEVRGVHVSEAIERYIVALVLATRQPQRYSEELSGWLDVGSSPRASIALDRCARARAWLLGKDFVDPDDVRAVVHPVLRHRMILSYEAQAQGIDSDRVISEIVRLVAVA